MRKPLGSGPNIYAILFLLGTLFSAAGVVVFWKLDGQIERPWAFTPMIIAYLPILGVEIGLFVSGIKKGRLPLFVPSMATIASFSAGFVIPLILAAIGNNDLHYRLWPFVVLIGIIVVDLYKVITYIARQQTPSHKTSTG